MSAPKALTGAPTTITVDDIDLHVYGVTITNVDNPLPAAIESTINALGLDGAIDFTKNYGTRQMSISGDITADTHYILLVYIDELTKLFRLRENGETIKVIFSDQSDRHWSCRYSGFSPKLKTLKNYGRTAAFQLNFICVKPYAEGVTTASALVRLNMNKNIVFDYPGTVKTPINFNITHDRNANLLDLQAFKVSSEDPTAWTYNNATGTTSDDCRIYGAVSICVNRTTGGSGSYYAEINVATRINYTKSYVFGGHARRSNSDENVVLQVCSNEGLVKSSNFTGSGGVFNFAQIKLTPSDLAGFAGIRFRVYCAGSLNDSFLVDGMFMYEISSADKDFLDSSYAPPPYITLTTPSVSNPKLVMVAGKNLFPLNNGETGWNGTGSSICNDPIGDGQCLVLYLSGAMTIFSPNIPITQNKVYKLSMNKLITMLNSVESGTAFYVRTRFLNENGDYIDGGGTDNNYCYIDNPWSTVQRRVTAPLGAIFMQIIFDSVSAECKAYIKDVSIEEEITYLDAFNAYTPYYKTEQTYVGVIDGCNEVNFNNDKLTSRFNSYDTKLSTNAMQYFSGDKIELTPGINTLRYYDARYGAAHPETASMGTCFCMYSYRARYL